VSGGLALASLPDRPLSGLERVLLVADRLMPPFVLQLVLEGQGEVSAERLQAALDEAAGALPGARVRLVGSLKQSRWSHDGPLPRWRQAQAPAWDGQSEAGAPFLADPLSARGPVLELVQVGPRLVLRALHAAMDGPGLLLFAEALFAALRGERPAPATAPQRYDRELVDPSLFDQKGNPPARNMPPLAPTGRGPGSTWRRLRIPGPGEDLLPRVISALAPGRARVDVPVDLRGREPGLRSTANLCGLVRLEVGPGVELGRALAGAVERGEAQRVVAQADALRGLPLWLLGWAGRREIGRGQRSGRFTTSATVSTLGRVDLQALSGGGWQTARVLLIPPTSPDLPLVVTMVEDDEGVELVAATPRGGDPGVALSRVRR